MSILTVRGLTHTYDNKVLFENAEVIVNNYEHIGVVGFNGAGKSTFINIIAQNVLQDEGEVLWQGGVKFGYLDQHADIDRNKTVIEYLFESFSSLFELEKRVEEIYERMTESIEENELNTLLEKAANMQEKLISSGFYELEAQIKKVANGLGVNAIGYDTKIGTLSGGQRGKVMLSKLLITDYDMIILDEPTNFLDIEHIDWLAKYLESYKGTFLLVSHDSNFLNKVCNSILSLENKEIKKYAGNYDAYISAHEENAKQYKEAYARQQREIKKMEDYIAKNKARAATAGMANSRKKMLERIDVMHKPIVVLPAEFSFACQSVTTKDMLSVKKLSIGYSKPILPPIDLHLEGGTKIWVRGTNGIGKSTLIKTLMGLLLPKGGNYKFHINAKIGYLEQDFDFRNGFSNAVSYISEIYPKMNQREVRTLLASVGLKNELAVKSIESLSGGEQVRIKLAALMKKETNILLLDEPTNHLDVAAKKALSDALKSYSGAIILVSHEAEFAEDICDKIFDVRD